MNSKKIVTGSYEKIMAIIIILIICSYTLEALLSVGDLTLPLLLLLYFIAIMYMISAKMFYKIDRCDVYIYLFIAYLVFHSLIKSDLNNVFRVVLASIMPYYLGRCVDINEKLYLLIRRVINIIGWMMIIKLFIEYLNSDIVGRIGIGDSNVIANGEVLGIFALINLCGLNKFNKDFISIFNYIVGILTCLIIIGSRGTVFAIITTTIIMYIAIYGVKIKGIVCSVAIITGYFFSFSQGSVILDIFPILNRFSIEGIFNDPSIVGNSMYEGRFQLYQKSIDIFEKNPIFGAGVGKIYSHNIFLEILSTLGLVAFILFLIWIINVGFKCKKTYKQNAIIVTLFIYAFIYRQSSFAIYAHKSLFIFAGMIVCTYQNRKKYNTK